jgi:hypothetical protein
MSAIRKLKRRASAKIVKTFLVEFRYNLASRQVERASYNGSIEASQASDVGSIPIARSISLDDSVAFMRLSR